MAPPVPKRALSLLLSFDLAGVRDWRALREGDHAAALAAGRVAAGVTYVPAAALAARAVVIAGDATIPAAQAVPWDLAFHCAEGKDVRVEFIYGRDSPTLAVRIVVALARCDGVTAVRLALHALEALEGAEVGGGRPRYAGNDDRAPFAFGARHAWNMLAAMLPAAAGWAAAPLARLLGRPVAPAAVAAPVTPAAVDAYWSGGAGSPPPPARLLVFPPAPVSAYRAYVSAVGSWAAGAGLARFLNLVAMGSARVCPSVVASAGDTADMGARRRGIFMPPGAPPPPPAWHLMNRIMAGAIFVNNYGRHTHTFAAAPTGFLWEWLHMAATVAGTGCITVNGRLLAWARWTPAGMRAARPALEAALGPAAAELTQVAATPFVE